MKRDFVCQIVGTILLVAAFILAIFDRVYPAIVVLAAVGLLDCWLVFIRQEMSISAFIRGLAPWRIDQFILVGLIPLCWWLAGSKVVLWFTLGLLNAHLFNIENRRK
jgi:hypothetical protein